jgi:hypothetical protein
VAALQAGEPARVLVEFESLSLDGECLAMARAAGRNHLDAAELPYRRSALAALEQNVTSEVAGVSILHDHERRRDPLPLRQLLGHRRGHGGL